MGQVESMYSQNISSTSPLQVQLGPLSRILEPAHPTVSEDSHAWKFRLHQKKSKGLAPGFTEKFGGMVKDD